MIGSAIANLDLINGIIAGICSLLQLVLKKKSAINYLLALLYFLMACLLIYFWSFRLGSIYNIPYLIYSDLAITFAIGPAAYLYIIRISGTKKHLYFSALFHFLPAVITMCMLLIYNTADGSVLKYYLNSRPEYPNYSENLFIYILSIIADLSLVIYFLLSIKKIYNLIVSEKFRPFKELHLVFYVFIAVTVSSSFLFYAHYLRNDLLITFVSGINGILGVYYFLFSYRHPEYTQMIIKKPRGPKTPAGLPGTVDFPQIMEDLINLMETENLYRDPELSIQSLSNSLGISSDNLSLVLNEKLGINFRTFIKRYRLDEARKMLTENNGKSILEIAFSVGFNSKTSFNTVFSKATGLTPTEYRRQYLKN